MGSANPDETQVYVVVEVKDPIQMKTFGDREDIAKAKEEAEAYVASTKIFNLLEKTLSQLNCLERL